MKKKLLILFSTVFAIYIVWAISVTPSHNRDWNTSQAVLPYSELEGNMLHVHNIRNFSYQSVDDHTVNYYDQSYDLNQLKGVNFIVSHFSEFEGLAHTFLSFEFENGRYLSVSVETRRNNGEDYSPIKGIFRKYELIYIVGDEKDLVKLRTNFRDEKVYLYPGVTTPEKAKKLLLSVFDKINKIKREPEFYNTLTNNCTNAIVRHIEDISPRNIPFSYKLLLPGYSDEIAYDLGLIPTDIPLEDLRKKYQINEKAKKYADDPDFSQKIRLIE